MKAPVKVVHVITRLIVGGAQENTIASVLGLQTRPGMTVRLLSGPTVGPEGSLEDRVSGVPDLFSRIPELVRPIRPVQDWLAYRRLTRIFRAWQPDLVHTHSGKAGFLGRLAAHRARVPVLVHTIHGPSFGRFQGPLSNLAFKSAERRAGRFTTHFVAVAAAMTEQYLRAGIGRPEQYTRIFSGFRLEPFQKAENDPALRDRLGLGPDDLVIGKIARLFPLKGHDDLFAIAPELVRRNPRLKFLLVGDGIWRARFEALAASQGLRKHFIFVGLVRPEEIPPLVGIMDALVHLSTREGLARALPQALAAGRPVVAYNCDGAAEVCRTGETGFLIEPSDRVGLARAILALATDEALRQRLGLAGGEFVKLNFAVEKMVENLYQLYLRLLENLPRAVERIRR